jgi:hypothetical protein
MGFPQKWPTPENFDAAIVDVGLLRTSAALSPVGDLSLPLIFLGTASGFQLRGGEIRESRYAMVGV